MNRWPQGIGEIAAQCYLDGKRVGVSEMSDRTVTWEQPTLRRRIVWNLTAHAIVTFWRPDPRGEFQETSRIQIADDTSAWHYLVMSMTDKAARITPQDWTAV